MELTGLLHLVIWLLVIGLVFYLLWWVVGQAALPEPFNKVIRIILCIIAVLLLISVLMGVVGYAPPIRIR